MSLFPKQEKIISAVLEGIKLAKNNYSLWTSHDLILSDIASNFLTIHICQEIAKLKNQPELFIDASIADILRCSLNKRNSFSEYMQKNKIKNSTFSITLDDKKIHKNEIDSISRVIISVNPSLKKPMSEYLDILNTMCKMIQKNEEKDSTLKYAIFAFYVDVSFSDRIKCKNKLEKLLKSFDTLISKKNKIKSFYQGSEIVKINEVGEYCFGLYLIESDFERKEV